VISHRPVGLAECTRVLFLRDGRLAPIAPGDVPSFAARSPARAARREGHG